MSISMFGLPKKAMVAADSTGTEEGKRMLQMIADGKISPEEGQRLLVALGKNETKKTKSKPTPMALKIVTGIMLLEIAIMVASAIIAPFEAILSTSVLTGLLVIICGSLGALCLNIYRNIMIDRIASPETPYASLTINMRYFHFANWMVWTLAIGSVLAVTLITSLRVKGLL